MPTTHDGDHPHDPPLVEEAQKPVVIFKVRAEKCATCLYAMKYDQRTRRSILGRVAEADSFVKCHSHDLDQNVCCRGFYDAKGTQAGPIRLAERFEALGLGRIEQVTAEMYPPKDDDGDDDIW